MANRLTNKYKNTKRELGNKLFAKYRVGRLENTNFSVISNNCWAGFVYKYFGLPYTSPTVGLYFYADEYLKFIADLKNNLSAEPIFIDTADSRYYDDLKKKGQEAIIVGKVNDIEIMFLHYKTKEEALEKWKRRAQRVNFDNLIVKFSFMNKCTEEHLAAFDKLPYKKKICFVPRRDMCSYQCAVYYPGYEKTGQILNDTDDFDRHLDLYKLINSDQSVLGGEIK